MSKIGDNTYLDDLIKEVKNRLEDYIRLSGRDVATNGTFRCLMPENHNNSDDDYSASISTKGDIKVWYCHVCHSGGTIYDLAHFSEGMPIHGANFVRATLELADRLSISVDHEKLPKLSDSDEKEVDVFSMMDLYREIESYIHNKGDAVTHLMSGEFGRTYDEKTAKKMVQLTAIGSVKSEDLTKHMIQKFGEDRTAGLPFYDQDSKLLAPYVFNQNRLAISVRDRMGRPVAFSGRAKNVLCDKSLSKEVRQAKYIHTKGFEGIRRSIAFMLDQAKKSIQETHRVYVVEGQFDCLAMHVEGFTNTVAMLGSSLTQEALDSLGPYKLYTMIFIPDMDKAGIESLKRTMEITKNYDVVVEAVRLPEGEDPDSIIRSGKKDLLQNITDAMELVLREYTAFHNKDKPVEKRYTEMISFVVKNCQFPVNYRSYAKIIGEFLGYHVDDILNNMLNYSDPNSFVSREEGKVMARVEEVKGQPIMNKIMVMERAIEDLKALSAEEDSDNDRTTWHDFLALISGKEELPTILETGLRGIDSYSDIECGSLTFVSGNPSNGKSSVLQYISLKMAEMYDDLKVLYVSTDDIYQKPLAGFISIVTGIPKKDVRGLIEQKSFMENSAASSSLERIRRLLDGKLVLRGVEKCRNVPNIRKELDKLRSRHDGPILTVVDAINDLDELRRDDQRIGLENVVRDFKAMAPTYNSAILTVSHMVKQQGEPQRPRLSDLKGSSFIEFAAKTVLLVYMDMHYKPNTELKWRQPGVTMGDSFPVIEVQIAKDKDNKAGEVAYLHFNPLSGEFSEPTREQVAYYKRVKERSGAGEEESDLSSGLGEDI